MTQLFPALGADVEAALRASIERFGVLVPVVVDQDGNVIDGRHRVRMAEGLGVGYRTDVKVVSDQEEARELQRTLNADRRHLTKQQRVEVARALRSEGHSLRAIAAVVGVDHVTVMSDLATPGGDSSPPAVRAVSERATGKDGRRYPANKEEAAAVRERIRVMREAGANYDEIQQETGAASGTVARALQDVAPTRALRDVVPMPTGMKLSGAVAMEKKLSSAVMSIRGLMHAAESLDWRQVPADKRADWTLEMRSFRTALTRMLRAFEEV